MTETPDFIPAPRLPKYSSREQLKIATENRESLSRRRSIRDFSDRPIPLEAIKECVKAAALAPSGANFQPWHFVLVMDSEIKKKIRVAAEAEEQGFYSGLAPIEWLNALAPLGTDAHKPFLEIAPCLIAIFRKPFDLNEDGSKRKNYYSMESVGIATGFLIQSLHQLGLSTLTHTPSPMNFLNKILKRPTHERPFLLLVTGYPNDNAEVPSIQKKPLDEISSIF